jgi:hypothetical protein
MSMRTMRIVAFVVALSCSISVGATSYPPVTFNELVARADVIFVGEVADVRPFPLETREGPIIKTRVVFRVWDPIYGTTSILEAFDFLGGEWGGVGMAIAEMPKFTIGERRVVFARRERSINPIVGFTQGLLKIGRDSGGVERVWTLDGSPLARVESIGTFPTISATQTVPMRLSEFRERVNRALAEERRR